MNPIEMLLVEDNEGDVRLTREALKDARIQVHLSVVRDGIEALAHLRKQGTYAEAITPDIILLDLNLPRMNGLDLLADRGAFDQNPERAEDERHHNDRVRDAEQPAAEREVEKFVRHPGRDRNAGGIGEGEPDNDGPDA